LSSLSLPHGLHFPEDCKGIGTDAPVLEKLDSLLANVIDKVALLADRIDIDV